MPGERRSRSPFVQPPSTVQRARTRARPRRRCPSTPRSARCVCWPTCVASQSKRPAVPAATAVVRPRVASYSPYLRIRSPHSVSVSVGRTAQRPIEVRPAYRSRRRASKLDDQSCARNSSTVACASSLEDVLHHPDLAVVVERQVDVLVRDEVHRQPLAGGAAHGEPERAVAGRQQEEGRREHRPRPVLRVAEERPRPLPRLDPRRRDLAELARHRLDARRHEVQEDARLEAERRPVELVVADEAVVLAAAGAGEADAIDDRDAPFPRAARCCGSPTARPGSPRGSGTRRCTGWSSASYIAEF